MKHKVYIGDNLRVMQRNKDFDQYGGKVSVIYIDPPYNTKTKKSYNDKRAREEWLEFMKARLILGRYYLSEEGVIFISIDDNEYAYLKVLCDKVFGEQNCLGTFITKQSQRSKIFLGSETTTTLTRMGNRSLPPTFQLLASRGSLISRRLGFILTLCLRGDGQATQSLLSFITLTD